MGAPFRLGGALMLLALCLGCSSAGLHVVISGPAHSSTELDSIEVRVSRDGEVLSKELFEVAQTALPLRVNFVSGEKAPPGSTLRIEVEARLRGAVVARATGEGTLEARTGGKLELTLVPLSDHPRLYAFKDNFDGTSLNEKWPGQVTGGNFTAALEGGQLKLRTQPNAAGTIFLASASTYDARENSARVEVISAGDPSLRFTGTAFGIHRDRTDFLGFYVLNGLLLATRQLGAETSGDVIANTPYDANAQRFWRIRENGGSARLEYSTDGEDWKLLAQLSDPFNLESTGIYFSLTSSEGETTATAAAFDNLNP